MKAKYFVSGLLIGVILATSVSVLAQNQLVEAWLADSMILNIDGNDKKLPKDVHIVNYDNRIYAPVRFVVEEMGGKVSYNADSARVIITLPEPVIKEVVIEKEVEPSTPAAPIINYELAPVRRIIEDVSVNVIGMSRGIKATYIYFDINNENVRSVLMDHDNAYVEIDGVKYPAIRDYNINWGSSISGYSKVEKGQLVFEEIPEGVKKMVIVIPMKLETYVASQGTVELTHTFTLPVDFTEK